jgi:hypothetical protein
MPCSQSLTLNPLWKELIQFLIIARCFLKLRFNTHFTFLISHRQVWRWHRRLTFGIWSVRDSIWSPAILTEVFRRFPQLLQASTVTIHRFFQHLLQFIINLSCNRSMLGARGKVDGWGTMLQAGRSVVRFPMRSLDFLIDLILLASLWPWGRLNELSCL